MKNKWKRLIFCLVLPLAVGGLATLLSGGMGSYKGLEQPPLSPPGWVFPVVWTALYLMMGYASWRVWESGKPKIAIRRAWVFYGIQLGLNFIWPILFFRFQWFLVAFVVLVLLWIAILQTMRLFTRLEERAGDLLIPYLLWVTFAGYLNFGVFLLN